MPGTDNSDNNLRPLCYSCNTIRGHRLFSDAEVLSKARWWYLRSRAKEPYWLNDEYNVETGRCEGGVLDTQGRMKRLLPKIMAEFGRRSHEGEQG